MKKEFNNCNDPELLRQFAVFLMGRTTELYGSIEEAWDEFVEQYKNK